MNANGEHPEDEALKTTRLRRFCTTSPQGNPGESRKTPPPRHLETISTSDAESPFSSGWQSRGEFSPSNGRYCSQFMFWKFSWNLLETKIRKTTQKLPKLTSWWCFPESSVEETSQNESFLPDIQRLIHSICFAFEITTSSTMLDGRKHWNLHGKASERKHDEATKFLGIPDLKRKQKRNRMQVEMLKAGFALNIRLTSQKKDLERTWFQLPFSGVIVLFQFLPFHRKNSSSKPSSDSCFPCLILT